MTLVAYAGLLWAAYEETCDEMDPREQQHQLLYRSGLFLAASSEKKQPHTKWVCLFNSQATSTSRRLDKAIEMLLLTSGKSAIP